MNFSWLLSSRNFFQDKKIWQVSWATENHQDEILRCPLITALGFHCPIYPAGKEKYLSQVMEKSKRFPAQSYGLNWEVDLTGVLHWNSSGHTPDLTASSLRPAQKWKTFSDENLKFRVYGGKEVIVPKLGEDRFMEEVAAILKKNS